MVSWSICVRLAWGLEIRDKARHSQLKFSITTTTRLSLAVNLAEMQGDLVFHIAEARSEQPLQDILGEVITSDAAETDFGADILGCVQPLTAQQAPRLARSDANTHSLPGTVRCAPQRYSACRHQGGLALNTYTGL